MNIIEQLGYFDDPSQTVPSFDPGDGAICPICEKPMGERTAETAKCRSIFATAGRSHFFYYHNACGEREGMAAVDRFEVGAVDEIARQESLQ